MLTIAISTMRVASHLIDKLKGYESQLTSNVKFLVVSQGEPAQVTENPSTRITVLKDTDKGLSKSRNRAIKACDTEWIWFQDDDIELNLTSVTNLLAQLEVQAVDVALLKVGSLEEPKHELYKNYSYLSWNNSLVAFKASSIEIVVRSKLLSEHKILFDENLGLGAALPSCEENLFLYSVFSKVSAPKLYYAHPEVACYHTTDIDTRAINQSGRVAARGYLCGKLPFYLGLPFLIKFFSINPQSQFSASDRVRLLLKGFKFSKSKKGHI